MEGEPNQKNTKQERRICVTGYALQQTRMPVSHLHVALR